MAAQLTSDVIGKAIDRSRMSGRLWWIMAIAGTGFLFDLFDAANISYALPAIQKEFHLAPTELGGIVSAGAFGGFLGTFGWGLIADKWGRRLVFGLTLLAYSLFSGLQALAVSATVLIIVRFVAGIGLGGAQPVDQVLLTEFSPARLRGRVSGSVQWLGIGGVLLAAALGLLLVPTVGWRWLFVAALPPLVLLVFVRRTIPESPRWLAARGRHEEARQSLRYLGITDEDIDAARQEVLAAPPRAPERPAKVADLFRGGTRARTIHVWLALFAGTFAGYGIGSFLPTIFSNVYGIPLTQTLQFTLLLAGESFLARLVVINLMDRVGRKWLMVVGFFVAGLAIWTFIYAQTQESRVFLLGSAMVYQLSIDTALVSLYVYITEIYPVHIRSTGASWAAGFGRLGAITAPLIVGALVGAQNLTGVWSLIGTALVAASVVSLLLGRETRGAPLEEIAEAIAIGATPVTAGPLPSRP